MTPALAQLVLERAPEKALEETARFAGWRSLQEDAVAKVRQGLTTASELWRVGLIGGKDAV